MANFNLYFIVLIIFIPALFGAFLSAIGLPIVGSDTWYIALPLIAFNSILCVYTFNRLRSDHVNTEKDEA